MQVRGDTSRIYALGGSFISNCKNNRIRYIQVTLLFDKAFFLGYYLTTEIKTIKDGMSHTCVLSNI